MKSNETARLATAGTGLATARSVEISAPAAFDLSQFQDELRDAGCRPRFVEMEPGGLVRLTFDTEDEADAHKELIATHLSAHRPRPATLAPDRRALRAALLAAKPDTPEFQEAVRNALVALL